jgi:hypothetical protein
MQCLYSLIIHIGLMTYLNFELWDIHIMFKFEIQKFLCLNSIMQLKL